VHADYPQAHRTELWRYPTRHTEWRLICRPSRRDDCNGSIEIVSTTIQPLELAFTADQGREEERIATELLGGLIQPDQYVGEVFSLAYETALVSIHDSHRQRVGGIPGLCFLVATRLKPGEPIDFTREDSSVILLRVMDEAALPNQQDAPRARVDAAQRAAGEATHWDEPDVMDALTAQVLSFAGMRCRVIGTFYLDRPPADRLDLAASRLLLRFGSDISNFYPNRGLKVYKPNDSALRKIVNYRDLLRVDADVAPVVVGEVRYASTNRAFQGVSNVPVEIVPEDLLGQKTAVFGMTRVGKSNSTKIIIRSVFALRFAEPKRQRVGQVIFDPNGEYANDNVQDADKLNPTAIRNIWRAFQEGDEADVVTFGTRPIAGDPNRKLMLINFFQFENLQIGKEIINANLGGEANYIREFAHVALVPPENYGEPKTTDDRRLKTRFDRKVLVYRCLLASAGFDIPPAMKEGDTSRLFNAELIAALEDEDANKKSPHVKEYVEAAAVLKRGRVAWGTLESALKSLAVFIHDTAGCYTSFNTKYMDRSDGSGEPWADADLKGLLGAFAFAGLKMIRRSAPMHTFTTKGDYAASIYQALAEGRLVLVDQSGGEEAVNRAAATRVMEYVFQQNRNAFRAGDMPPEILVYIEEAHNILPDSSKTDYQDIWVRTAKEGAKYRLGMVYATQEVSSIQKNILKNTANWFIGHLNNTDETRELTKYYDFADFENSILRAQDRGFLRVKTLSNLFVVPVQVSRFIVGA
jgi:hypothetical protein